MEVSAIGDICVSREQDGLHPHLQMFVSDTPTPTHHPPLLHHIGCLSSLHSVKGHLSVNNSTLLHIYLEWLSFYIQRGVGFVLCWPAKVCSYFGAT